jgi:hypothetical protein
MACVTNYTVQCKDETTGETGCFLFDTEHWQRTGKFRATSPVFPSLVSFFAWDTENGFKRGPCYLERSMDEEE